MRSQFLPFSRPSISKSEISAVEKILRSGWITTGAATADFEKKFRRYTGCENAVSVSSGTGGMHIILRALNIAPGDEIITPSMTWVSTVNLIVLAGARPVFADVDRDTLLVDYESVRRCLSPRTRLIIPVHFAGVPADMTQLNRLASQNEIPIVEDAAHAVGSAYKGVPVGGSGTAVFSFHPIKNITTGEGGMICSSDTDLVERLRRLKFHGLGEDAYDREIQGRSPTAEVIEPGYKYNMTDICAAMGLCQLERIEKFNRKRSELAGIYLERLSQIDEILPLSVPDYPMKHSWHLFIVRLDPEKAGMSRGQFMLELKRRNIGTGYHFRAVHLHSYYKRSGAWLGESLENTEWNSERICSLPLFPDMTEDDVDDVVEAIKDVLKR